MKENSSIMVNKCELCDRDFPYFLMSGCMCVKCHSLSLDELCEDINNLSVLVQVDMHRNINGRFREA